MAKTTKKKTAARGPKAREKGSVKASGKTSGKAKKVRAKAMPAAQFESDAVVLDRLFAVVESRRDADPTISHSARLLSRGPAKVAQKFGEEAVECLIEAVAGNRDALVAESADVLYHLLVLWVSSGVAPTEVWAELIRREGISGIAEKAARTKPVAARRRVGTSKIP
jgi:phosphoribosyl-ATP pyrophosphohydrolase